MAAKKTHKNQDPKKNKSSAIRRVIKKMPTANSTEVAAAVKDEFGHTVNSDRIFMVKTKKNMVAARKKQTRNGAQVILLVLLNGLRRSRSLSNC